MVQCLVSTERRETFHLKQDPLYRRKLSPEISSPRRLRVKGADTDSIRGRSLESGETGILVADGFLEDGSSANEASPPDNLDYGSYRGTI
jgi:hypothetical protein